jgi:hypothetical protein
MAVNTATSLIKDKKIKNGLDKVNELATDITDNTGAAVDDLIHKDIASGVSISSTRALNVFGSPTLFYLGYKLLTEGKQTEGIVLISAAVIYAVGLAFVTYLKENK